jgi:hypothetical protein
MENPPLPYSLYQKSYLCIPRKEAACSHYLHSSICEQFIYSQDKSAYLAAGNKQIDP